MLALTPALPRVVVVSALALLLAACTPGAQAPAPRAPAAPAAGSGERSAAPAAPAAATAPAAPLRVRAAYTTISAVAAPWWMADMGGYFREQGLDLELIHVDAGATLLAALRNGELDVTYAGAPSLVVGYLQGLETMIIGSTSNGFDTVIFTRPEIERLDQLKGKVIAVNRLKAISDVGARMGLQRLGLQPDVDFTTRATGGQAETLAAMETGVVDGAAVSPPVVFEARKRGYRELVNVNEMNLPFLNSAVGATRRTLTERPELGERTLRALAQAVSRLKTDREYSIEVLGKYSRLDDRELLGATVDYFRNGYTTDPFPEPALLQTVLDAEENPAARTTRPEEILDLRFAEAVRASGFLDTLTK